MNGSSNDGSDDSHDVLSSIRKLVAEEAESHTKEATDVSEEDMPSEADKPLILGEALLIEEEEQPDGESDGSVQADPLGRVYGSGWSTVASFPKKDDGEGDGLDDGNEIPESNVLHLKAEDVSTAEESPLILANAILESELNAASDDDESAADDSEKTSDDAAEAAAPILKTGEADYFDEDALRSLVSSMVQEELQGELGERITRNIRKIVRREVLHVLDLTGTNEDNIAR